MHTKESLKAGVEGAQHDGPLVEAHNRAGEARPKVGDSKTRRGNYLPVLAASAPLAVYGTREDPSSQLSFRHSLLSYRCPARRLWLLPWVLWVERAVLSDWIAGESKN